LAGSDLRVRRDPQGGSDRRLPRHRAHSHTRCHSCGGVAMKVPYKSRHPHRNGPAHCYRLRCYRVVCRERGFAVLASLREEVSCRR
jgi:hypothetical protein